MNSLSTSGYRITGNLNEGIGDAAPGSSNKGISGLPTVEGAYDQLGVNVFIDTAGLVSCTNPAGTIGTLYGGWYKYVQFKSTWSATLAAGQPLFYDTVANMLLNVVTPDIAATSILAGFALCAGITKGNYWWIQVGGIATVLCKSSSVTDNTAGDVAILTGLTTATIDGLADAGAVATAGAYKQVVGQFLDAPVAGALKRILMRPIGVFQ